MFTHWKSKTSLVVEVRRFVSYKKINLSKGSNMKSRFSTVDITVVIKELKRFVIWWNFLIFFICSHGVMYDLSIFFERLYICSDVPLVFHVFVLFFFFTFHWEWPVLHKSNTIFTTELWFWCKYYILAYIIIIFHVFHPHFKLE